MVRINKFKKLLILGVTLFTLLFGQSASVTKASTDGWQATSINGAPSGGATAVWTGSEMIIWGGSDVNNPIKNTGARYNPATNTWTPTSTVNAPSPRRFHTAIWTGTEMVVWGGEAQTQFGIIPTNTGAQYNPTTDTWTSISTVNAAQPRKFHTAVWTGSEMIVYGGSVEGPEDSNHRHPGGRYNPVTDTWTLMPTDNIADKTNHTAVWTGTEMIVWGGEQEFTNTGGRYNPATNTWTPTSTAGAPSARRNPTAVWTGSEMIIWGGLDNQHGPVGETLANTGARYNPDSDSWTPTTTVDAPSPRSTSPAVWTGTEMIVWGGTGGGNAAGGQYYALNTGGRYNPATDLWTSTTLNGAPTCRGGNTEVWTGDEMIIWGGNNIVSQLNTGGRYNPTVGNNAPPTLCEPNSTPAVNAGSSYQVNEGGSVQVTAAGNDPGNGTLTYAWDLDNNGSYETPGQAVSFSAANLDGPTSRTIAVQMSVNGSAATTDQATVNVFNVAPSVGVITGPTGPVQVNTSVNTSDSFTDASTTDTHTAVWDWGDTNTSAGTITETNGSGSVTGSHIYTAAGVYTVNVTVTDDDNANGQPTNPFEYVVVFDPNGGYVTGAGTINSPIGAYTADLSLTGLAHFGFNSKYAHGANVPTGNTKFRFQAGDLKFESTSYEWLVVAGAKAQYKGVGTINGSGNYGFLLSAIDGAISGGGGTDKFRIKIWDKNNNDAVVYDNQPGAAENADATTVVNSGSSIVIHP